MREISDAVLSMITAIKGNRINSPYIHQCDNLLRTKFAPSISVRHNFSTVRSLNILDVIHSFYESTMKLRLKKN